MEKEEIIIFDFDEQYPQLDNPLEALVRSLMETEDYTCSLFTNNTKTVELAIENNIPYKYVTSLSYKNLATLFSLIKVVRKENAILHAFGTYASEVITKLHSRFGKNKLICTFTSLPEITSLPKAQKQYATASIITAPTRHFMNTMAHILQIPPNKTAVIPIGVTKEIYLHSIPHNDGRVVFTVVAPLEKESSLFEILDSLSVLHKASILPEWEVRFIGVGSLFSSLIEYATQIGIVDKIALLGNYPLPPILQRTTVLIIPVFFWNIAQVIYGGVLSGIPIVHTKDANVLDIVNFHHKDTSSFTQGDAVEIRSAIKYVLESQQTLHTPVYSLEQTINGYHAIYRKLI